MYAGHVPKISAAMHVCPETFARGIMFAVLSARVPFVRVPEMLKDVDIKGKFSEYLWGWKRDAYRFVERHKLTLWNETCASRDMENALVILTRVPGLGLVKAGFVLQMLGHDIACLDTRNIQREGRNPRAYRSDGEKRKNTAAFRRKITRYVRDVGGKARPYWDDWCIEVAGIYDMTPEQVSETHMCVVPAHLRNIPVMALPTVGNSAIPF